jgi:glycosyltransferase involved in cell wall biosynthesis
MRVLHIEGGKHLYGGAYQVLHLLRLLKGRGEHILACPIGSAIAAEAQKAGIDVIPIPLNGEGSVKACFAIRRIIRERQPDIVHVHSRRGADLWGVLAAKLSHVSLVITRRVDNPELPIVARFRYGPAVRVVGISKKICEVLEFEGVTHDKLRCIRSGVDTSAYAPHEGHAYLKEQFDIAHNEHVVAMAAQFIERKGHATLLAAVPAILMEHPRTRFLIVGQGPLLDDIRAQAAQFAGRVIVPGFRADFAQILPECDVLVHPAQKEGLGVVILQAAACGVPVVASRAGGIPEVVSDGKSGYLVEPHDIDGFAQQVNALLGNKELCKEMGRFARNYAMRELSIDATAAANYELYKEISAERE